MANQIRVHNFDRYVKSFSITFMSYMNDYDRFSANFKLLLQNLTSEQQNFLINIFSKVLFAYHSNFYTDNNFSNKEIEEQGDIRLNLLSKIVQEGNYHRYKDYLLPVNHFELTTFYYNLGINYLSNLDRLKGKAFIDAGAYIGDSPLILSKLNPAKIYAFEPVSEIYETMIQTINLNKLNGVIEPVKLGLASNAGESEIYLDGSSSGIISKNADGNLKKEIIKTTTIDQFVEENNLQVGLIKMDTEGTELDILKGAENTIKTQKPALIVGIYHNAEEFFEAKPLLESWNPDYRFQFAKFNPFSFLLETTLICEV